MPTYRDQAVVLRTRPLGEADRIVTSLTATSGKVRAVAKGVRRTSSKFGGRLEPFNHIDAQFARGRGSLDVVAQVETLHTFGFGRDYPDFTAAQVLVEACDQLVAEEHQPAPRQFRLILGALRALDEPMDGRPAGAVVDSYLLRALAVGGYEMAVARCAGCAEPDPGWFSARQGGLICEACRLGPVTRVALDTRRRLAGLAAGDWAEVARTEGEPAAQASGIVAAFTTWQMERTLRSWQFLVR